MIGYLKGTILSKREKTLLLDVGNVGYEVFVPRSKLEKLALGETIALYIHTNVREDDISLFGVSTEQEMSLLKLLITVSGIGPRVALEILTAPIADVQNAIAHKDTAYLTRIPGIGKKIAERMCVEISSKVMELAPVGLNYTKQSEDMENMELVDALMSLGYKRTHVINGLKKIPSEVKGEEAIIKYFLQHSL